MMGMANKTSKTTQTTVDG